jgi:hypothetical protein
VPTYTVNKDAMRHAQELIDARQYVLRSRWQDRQPRARGQNTFLTTLERDVLTGNLRHRRLLPARSVPMT